MKTRGGTFLPPISPPLSPTAKVGLNKKTFVQWQSCKSLIHFAQTFYEKCIIVRWSNVVTCIEITISHKILYFLGIFVITRAYVGDISDDSNVSFVMAIATSAYSMGLILGSSLGGNKSYRWILFLTIIVFYF